MFGIGQGAAQCLVQLQAVGQLSQRVVPREEFDFLGALALGRNIGSDAAESQPLAVAIEHRRARKLPPPNLAANLGLDHEIGEAFPPLQFVRQFVEALREFAIHPPVARNELEEGLSFDFPCIALEREGEARTDRTQAAIGVDLPQPVGLPFLEFAQQHRDGRALFLHFQLGKARFENLPRDFDQPQCSEHGAGQNDQGQGEIQCRQGGDQTAQTGGSAEGKRA